MRKEIALLLCICLSTLAHAIHVERLTVDDNLLNNETVNITQDLNGSMWFLSEEGVDVFSGGQFITPDNLRLLIRDSLNSRVRFIEASQIRPHVYLSNKKYGLSCYNIRDREFEETPIISYLRRKKVNNISYILSKGRMIWFVSSGNGIYKYNQTSHQITAYDKSTIPEFRKMGLNTIAVKNHMVYLGTWASGFATLDTRSSNLVRYTKESTYGNLVDNSIRAIEVMRNGLIWVGSAKGLSLFTNEKSKPFIYYSSSTKGHQVPDKMVYDITQLKDGSLLVGVELHGIYKLSADKVFRHGSLLGFEKLKSDYSSLNFSEFSVREIFQDTFKNVWISTYGGGIGFVSHEPPVFTCLTRMADGLTPTSLSHPVAWGVTIDDQGRVWVGTDGKGIDVFKDGRRLLNLNQKTSDGIGMSVLCAAKGKNGILWFGTYQHGLFKVDPKTMKLEPVLFKTHKLIEVRDISVDANNNLWVSSIHGLYKVSSSRDSIQCFGTRNTKLHSNHVRTSYVDSRGLLWVVTYTGGIQVFNLETMKEIVVPVVSDITDFHIRKIIEDSRQQIWVASDQGLIRINIDSNGANKRIYTEKDGLTSNNVQAIVEFPEGVIWGSTTRGVIRIGLDDERLSCYTKSNSKRLHSFRKNSVAHDDTRLYFGSSEGLWSFNPFRTQQVVEAPRPIVSACYPLGDTKSDYSIGQLTYTQPASLSRSLPGLEIGFVVPDYAYHNRLTYQYQLEGGDDRWYDLGQKQQIILRNILPGKYRLNIRSVLDGDINNVSTALLKLNIMPPFWMTWWFFLIVFSIVVALVWGSLRYYIKQLKLSQMFELEKQAHVHESKLHMERLRYFTDITHEIRTPLTLIIGPLRDLLENDELSAIVKKEVQVIYRSAQRLLNLTNMLIMFRKAENNKLIVKPKYDDMSKFCAEHMADLRVLNRKKNVQMQFSCQSDMKPIYFDRGIMAIVLNNLLSNALKHTREGTVLLDVQQNPYTDQTVIRIQDSGVGISSKNLEHIFQRWHQTNESDNTISNGIGLSIVKELVEKHQGRIEAQSVEGEGTVFTVYLRTSNRYGSLMSDASESSSKSFVVDSQDSSEVTSGIKSYIVADDSASDLHHELSLQPTKSTKPELLIVEDDVEVQDYIAHIFEAKYSVITAGNGLIALEVLKTHNIQFMISDFMMPVMDGIELCNRVKNDERYAHIPVVILTANTDNEQRERGYQAGANSFLTKPFSAKLLKSRVDNLMTELKQAAEQKAMTSILEKKVNLRNNLSHIEQEFVSNMNSLIEENLSKTKVDVAFLAENLNMSNSTLYRRVKQITGISTNEYIRHIRLKKAEILLLKGQYTISEVSDMVGMTTPDYFRQCFKEAFGVSPSEYVKSVLNQ